MKKLILLLFLPLILILASCADASVSYELLDDNDININYLLTLSTAEDISAYTDSLTSFWESGGFNTDTEKNGSETKLTADKSVSYNTASKAADKFSDELTSEDSIFYNVDFAYSPSYFEDNYSLSATISLKDVIRQSKVQDIPPGKVDSFFSLADKGKYTLSISLPGEITFTNADETNGNVCTWIFKLGDERNIRLSSKKIFEENVVHYQSLTESRSRDLLLFIVCCSAAGALVIALIILAIVRKSRSSKIYYKGF